MQTNYNEFVPDYEKTENSLFRKYVERSSVLKVLGNVEAKSILDLACGLGNYTRLLKRQGATHVVGIDISEGMIARAKMLEEEEPLGIKYITRDVTQLEQIGLFDLATAMYLFPYAQTEQDLAAMTQAIYNNLKSQGRLVAITLNPEGITKKHCAVAEDYHIYITVENDFLQDGTPISIVMRYPEQKDAIRITTYYWSRDTYETVLKKAGFHGIKWHTVTVSEDGIKQYGKSFWQDYLATPHIGILECHK